MAAHACPSRSVHPPADVWDDGSDPYPMPLDDAGTVLLCGHASPQTHRRRLLPGAPPRRHRDDDRHPALARRFEKTVGKVTDVLLTHLDHGRKYADAFGARLWIHEGDLHSRPDADHVIRGQEPVEIGPGVIAHPFPGHTEGSTLFIADEKFCFTGDAFFWSVSQQDLEVADSVVYDSIKTLAKSVQKGAEELTFEWVLPGHGSFHHLPAAEMRERMRALGQHAGTYPE